MKSLNVDRRIEELLADPLVSLMIQADHVERNVLARDLHRIAGIVGSRRAAKAENTRDYMSRTGVFRPQSDVCGACGT